MFLQISGPHFHLCTLDCTPINMIEKFVAYGSTMPPVANIPQPMKIRFLIQGDMLISPPNLAWGEGGGG